MFCIHCGKEIPDDAKFCKFCGQSCTYPAGSPENPGASGPQENESDTVSVNVKRSNIPCPHCGAKNCQPITKTNTQSQAGGYSCCAGACGGILLGPLGLLLGLCGKKATSSVTTQTKWVCMNCGREFISLNDAQELWKKNASAGVELLCVGVPFSILMLLGIAVEPSGPIILLVGFLLSFIWGTLLLQYMASKNGYDCYSLDALFTQSEWAKWKRSAYTKVKHAVIGTLVVAALLVILLVLVILALL